ncbi:MAG: hypothetical protein K0R38_6275 [Polyangiaceae bacterium]|jgi:hypothetical protein|nr:hypothetical protein [Polyangiaceae bacterium]
MKIWTGLLSVSLCAGCGAQGLESEAEAETWGETESALSNKDFSVDFTGCAEFAGIGFVPAERARPLVPASYALAGDAQNAIAVVRVASCQDAVLDGKSLGATITSQIGITLAGGDPTADINNYTVAYATNQGKLHARFQAAGLKVANRNDLSLDLLGATLSADGPDFEVVGTSGTPTSAPTTFAASWWSDGKRGAVQSRTAFPDIRFGASSSTLTTQLGTELGELLGAATMTFAVLDSYNTFATAHLEVRGD